MEELKLKNSLNKKKSQGKSFCAKKKSSFANLKVSEQENERALNVAKYFLWKLNRTILVGVIVGGNPGCALNTSANGDSMFYSSNKGDAEQTLKAADSS